MPILSLACYKGKDYLSRGILLSPNCRLPSWIFSQFVCVILFAHLGSIVLLFSLRLLNLHTEKVFDDSMPHHASWFHHHTNYCEPPGKPPLLLAMVLTGIPHCQADLSLDLQNRRWRIINTLSNTKGGGGVVLFETQVDTAWGIRAWQTGEQGWKISKYAWLHYGYTDLGLGVNKDWVFKRDSQIL